MPQASEEGLIIAIQDPLLDADFRYVWSWWMESLVSLSQQNGM